MPDPTPISGLPSDATLALDDVIIVNHDNGDGSYTTERATLTEVQTLIGGGGGGGGVPSVNGITAAVTIISPDDSVGVEVVGDEIQLTTSGGGGGGGGGSNLSSRPATYDQMVLSEPGLTYYWPFSDASGAFLDLVLGRGWTVNGSPTYNATSLLENGDAAAAFPDDTAYLSFDASIVTRNGEPWTLEFFFELGSTPTADVNLWNQEASGNGFALLVNTSNEVFLDIFDVGDTNLFTATPGTPYHFALVYDGFSLYWWMNGTLHYLGSFGYTFTATASSATIKGGPLTMQKLALYSLALSKTRLQAHYEALSGTTWSWPFPVGASLSALTPLIEFEFSGSTSTNSFAPTVGQRYTAIWEGSDDESFCNLQLGDGTGSNYFGIQYHASSGSAYTLTSDEGGDTVGNVINVPSSGSGSYRNMVCEFIVTAANAVEMRGWVDGCFIGYAQCTVSNIASLIAATGGQTTRFFNIYPGWLITEPLSTPGPTITPYDAVIVGQSPTHYWPLSDAPGSTTAVDLVGGQPLTVSGDVAFGAPGLAEDGSTSFYGNNASGAGLVMPSACQPTDVFSISFICSSAIPSGTQLWAFGQEAGNFCVGVNGSSPACWAILNQLNAWYKSDAANSGARMHVAVTWDGSVFYLWLNGSPAIIANGFFTPTPSTATGLLCKAFARLAKAAIWNGTVLSLSQILVQVAAAGL